jgi:hypothetical protein
LVSGGNNGTLLVHDVVTGACLYGFGAHRGCVRAAGVSATEDRVVSVGDDGKVAVLLYN